MTKSTDTGDDEKDHPEEDTFDADSIENHVDGSVDVDTNVDLPTQNGSDTFGPVRHRMSSKITPKTIFGDSLKNDYTNMMEMTNTLNKENHFGALDIEKVVMEVDVEKIKNEKSAMGSSGYDANDLRDVDIVTKSVILLRQMIYNFVVEYKFILVSSFLMALFVLYFVFFGFAIEIGWKTTTSYCDGVKFLFIITVLSGIGLIYFQIIKRFFGKILYKHCIKPLTEWTEEVWEYRFVRWLVYLVLLAAVVTFLVIDSKNNRSRLISATGIVVFTLLGFIFSKYPGKIRWRHVLWGLGLQFLLALMVLRWSVGREVFQCLGDKVQIFLDYTDQGSSFVFGYLTTGNMTGWTNATESINGTNYTQSYIALPLQDQLFGFKVLPVMFYFSFFISILYFYGVMQWLVQKIGWCLQVTVGTTACESISAAACIFVGQTEAPLVIKPYLPQMTLSEIHAIMTGGFANIAGSTLAAYISFGVDASHLLTASIMSAPAALGFAKLMLPETEISQTHAEDIKIEKGTEKNALEAAANGASIAIPLVANIAANLISFIAFIYFLDGVFAWMGALVGWTIDFETLLGYIFMPMAFMMGVEWQDCDEVGQLIGIKTIINEFVAYSKLGEYIDEGAISIRSQTIATYALCGFSNLSSIGIQLGCLGAMAPERKEDFARIALRALISGSAACFMTACVAGALIDEE